MVKKYSYYAFVFVAITTSILVYFAKDTKFNYIFESFFPVGDPDLEYYQEFKKNFENDNNYLLIGLVNKPSIFDSTFLQNVASLSDSLNSLSSVKSVTSITTIEKPVISPVGLFQVPLVHPYQPERMDSDSLQVFQNKLLIESIVSEDGQSTAILLKHFELSNKDTADSLTLKIEQLISNYNFQKVHIAGKLHAQGVFVSKMIQELILFTSASLIFIVLFLLLAYRTWWGVLIPLAVVTLSVAWIVGIMAAVGKSMDLLMVILPTIMFVVGMSDVVHIMTKYIEQLRLGDHKIRAIKTTFREVGLATFLTSLTTSIGFFTLITASIRPIQEFGIYTGIGVFVAFIVAFTLLPSSLMLLPKPRISKKSVNASRWFGILSKSFLIVLKNAKIVLVINLLLVAGSLYGISQIFINTYLIEDLPADDPLKESFTFFDVNFGGSRPFEISIEVNDTSKTTFSPDLISEIAKVENYLAEDLGAGSIASPATIIKSLNQALNGGAASSFALPSSQRDWQKTSRYLKRILKRDDQNQLVTDDLMTGRITARVGDIGSALSLEKTEELKKYISNNTNKDLATFVVTGTSNLIDKNNEYLSRNMFEGLGIAFGIVALIAGLMFKSVRMVFITLIPNIIPLLIVAGIMGVFGITLKLSTSIIFTIAFGIAVDDTIHFISKLKLELLKEKSLIYALKRTYLSTGKAIIVTSIILSGGFFILILSSFGGTFYTGLLISLTLMLALVVDLTLLPVMILLFYKK